MILNEAIKMSSCGNAVPLLRGYMTHGHILDNPSGGIFVAIFTFHHTLLLPKRM